MSKVRVTIDGRELYVDAGKTIIQAAHEAGITIPYYCYHPGLVVDGNCRICLVEVEKAPKLMVGCKTAVNDGMVVHTNTARVQDARRGVQEFMLVNHPIDCPVCDQAGECKLQDYYYDYDLANSRVKDLKVHKPKVVDFGRHVKFDGERCILCSRCVRFTRDVSETYELGIYNRGDHSVIGLTPGMTLDNPYSMNTIDICPVGALTSKDFRFKKRVWFMDEHKSVCPGCSRGCAVWLDADAKENKVYRTRPRKNLLANQYWMCDFGRFTFEWVADARLDAPQIAGASATWDAALAAAVEALRGKRLGVLVSPSLTNEELVALAALIDGLGGAVLGLGQDRVPAPDEVVEDDFLIDADKHPNRRGAVAVFGSALGDATTLAAKLDAGEVDTLLVTGRRAGAVLGAALAKASTLVLLSAHNDMGERDPDVALPGCVFSEKAGSYISAAGVVSAFAPAVKPAGQARDELAILAALGEALGVTVPADVRAAWVLLGERIPALAALSYDELLRRTAVSLDAVEGVA